MPAKFNDKTCAYSFCDGCPIMYVRIRLVKQDRIDDDHVQKEFDLECGHIRGCSKAYAAGYDQQSEIYGKD